MVYAEVERGGILARHAQQMQRFQASCYRVRIVSFLLMVYFAFRISHLSMRCVYGKAEGMNHMNPGLVADLVGRMRLSDRCTTRLHGGKDTNGLVGTISSLLKGL